MKLYRLPVSLRHLKGFQAKEFVGVVIKEIVNQAKSIGFVNPDKTDLCLVSRQRRG